MVRELRRSYSVVRESRRSYSAREPRRPYSVSESRRCCSVGMAAADTVIVMLFDRVRKNRDDVGVEDGTC